MNKEYRNEIYQLFISMKHEQMACKDRKESKCNEESSITLNKQFNEG